MKRDEAKTLIYRGTTKSGSSEPQWQRCMARTSRPFSTVILNEKVKQDLIDDVTDYLNPTTRRWYANRGIPYRRGYLLYGPPGTGKSSLSLALAGFFKMRIYIVSLSSVTANEENLATLFAELPRRCVVLLEDIDTAGLTHTRDEAGNQIDVPLADATTTTTRNSRGPNGPNNNTPVPAGRLSLSGLLNILDGVASQEGRVLIMTTNHLEKLDKALIRPGRVDMTVKFDRADTGMISAIFRAIFAPIEGDEAPAASADSSNTTASASTSPALFSLENRLLKTAVAPRLTPEEEKKKAAEAAEAARKKAETIARVEALAETFAARIPAHEFSPAEIQGYLLKNKRTPEKATEGAEQWVVETRKEKKEKELQEAEEKRKAEEKEKEEKEAEKKKDEEEGDDEEGKKKGRKKGGKNKRKTKKSSSKKKRSAKDSEDESGSSSSSSSDETDSESESEKEKEKKPKRKSKPAPAVVVAPAPAPATAAAAPTVPEPAPVELKGDDAGDASEVKAAADAVVVVVPTIKVDTVKAKEAEVEAHRTPGADSGYGTPA